MEQSRRRARSQPRRAAAHARGGVHHRGAGEGRGAGAAAHPSVSRARPRRSTATPRSSCGSSSAIGSAATIRPTGRCGRRSCRNCRKRPSARSRTACGGSATASCRRRWSRSIRRPATCWRSSAGATSGSRSSTARGAAGGSRARRSSRFCSPRRWRRGYSPVSVLDGLMSIAPQGPDEWAPRNASGEVPEALTLRAALIESNNRAAALLQQRIGSRPGAAPGVRRRPARSARRAVALARHRPGDAAGSRPRRSRCFPTAAAPSAPRALTRVIDADGGVAYDNPARQDRVVSSRRSRTRWCRCCRTSSTAAPRRRRDGLRRPLPGRRQDGHDRRFQGRLVRRLHDVHASSACGSARISPRRSGAKATARATRCRSGASSSRPRRASAARGSSRCPQTHAARSCSAPMSYLKPVEELPDLHRVLQGGGRHSRRGCARCTRDR